MLLPDLTASGFQLNRSRGRRGRPIASSPAPWPFCRLAQARPDPWELPRIYTTERSLPLFAARISGLSLARRAGLGRAAAIDVQ